MTKTALALLLLFTPALLADNVVDAARAAKAKRKKSTTRVITNADVTRAKGKAVETQSAGPVAEPPAEGVVQRHQTARRERAAAEQLRVLLIAKIAALEKELASIEQQYYGEDDLNRRDTVIVRRFADAKLRLDAARKDLAEVAPPAPAATVVTLPNEP